MEEFTNLLCSDWVHVEFATKTNASSEFAVAFNASRNQGSIAVITEIQIQISEEVDLNSEVTIRDEVIIQEKTYHGNDQIVVGDGNDLPIQYIRISFFANIRTYVIPRTLSLVVFFQRVLLIFIWCNCWRDGFQVG
ncbi:hypothetical protein U1Q18_008715 [Sarracenia purpurea var. burkii]